MTDEIFMKKALCEAQKAFDFNEVPIGAVVVHEGKVIGRGHNKIERRQDPCAHAEIIAITAAAKKLGTWRLDDCELFVSVEPCLMCLGACFQSRIKRIVFGTDNIRFGGERYLRVLTEATDSPLSQGAYIRKPEVVGKVLEEECRAVLQAFFKQIRKPKE